MIALRSTFIIAAIWSTALCQAHSVKTPVRIVCVCDDPLTSKLLDGLIDGLNATSQYTEAPSHTPFNWKVSVDSAPAPDLPSAIALSIVVTRDSLVIDQWAAYCTKAQIDRCTAKLLQGVTQAIEIELATSEGVSGVGIGASRKVQPEPPPPPSRHHTGDDLTAPVRINGKGTITVACPAKMYSRVRVIDAVSRKMIRDRFISPDETLAINGIPPGFYWVQVAQASYFNDLTNSLQGPTEYFRFPHTYQFKETDLGTSIEYDQLDLTISKVSNGNVEPVTISADDFWSNRIPAP